MVPWKNSHQLWNLASALAKQPSVSHRGLKGKQIEPLRPYLVARGRTIQTHSGWGASSKSTVAHAGQRRVTVCSLTWQQPVKYTLSTKQLLQARSLTASMRAQTYKVGGVRQKIFNDSFMETWLYSKQTEKQLLQQEKSAGLASGIISTAAGKLGCWKGK